MQRQDRRMLFLRWRNESSFEESQRRVENAWRARTARRLRGHIRRLQPIALVTPRWSAPQGFLEDLALDLAVGDSPVACRTISMRPMMGRSQPEAWNFLLRVLGEICGPEFENRPVPMVADRRGFLYAAEQLLALAYSEAPVPIALLVHGTEHLPVEVLGDFATIWSEFTAEHRDRPRCTLLLAGSVETPAFHAASLPPIELSDFGEAEAAASLLLRVGTKDIRALRQTARLSGGIPAVVQALLRPDVDDLQATEPTVPRTRLPADAPDLLKAIGPLADELRLAVTGALSDPDTAGRFFALADAGPLPEHPSLDTPLLLAGLARRVHGRGVELRSPALPAFAP